MVANPSWDPAGSWTNTLDDGDPWVAVPAHWQQGWFAASGISSPVNSGSPQNNSANISISGGVLLMKVAAISGTNYGCLMTTNPANSGTATGLTFTPPYAVEALLDVPGPSGSVLVPNWVAWWSDGTGQWPTTGEVDCLESLGTPDWNSFHIHDSTTEPPSGTAQGGTHNLSPPSGLHTFGYYRTATQVFFYYDGVLVGTKPIATAAPHYLILTHTYNTTPDVIPSTLGVHWVRAWTPATAPTTGMTVTATASGTQTAAGVALTVRVLTGGLLASSQAGATVHNEALATPQLTLTPGGTGNLLAGAVASSAASAFTGRDANTTFYQNTGDAASNESYLTFRATALSTAGQAVTAGATGPAAPSQLFGVMAEIQAAPGSTLAEDASSPASVFASALSATTAGFTPPGGALLVALVSANYNNAGTPTVAMTVTDSTGLTWTQLVGNSGAAGQDLASVWVAGGVSGSPATGPITGPPATSRALVVSAAPKAGTDAYGNPYPQGIQVGASSAPQVALLPISTGAQVQFPIPAPSLSNIPNMTANALGAGTHADLILSGPALAAAGVKDWTQIILFSNDNAGTKANLQLRYIDTAGAVTIAAEYNNAQWLFNLLAVFAGKIIAQDPANPGTFEPWHTLGTLTGYTVTTGRFRLLPTNEVQIEIDVTAGGTNAASVAWSVTLPAAYRPGGSKRRVLGAASGTMGTVEPNVLVSAAGVVTVGQNASTTLNLYGDVTYPLD